MTGESDNQTAIRKFKEILNSSASYFNEEPFPEIESNKEAYRKCSDIEGAKKYCPKRLAALELWMAESRKAGFVTLSVQLLLLSVFLKDAYPCAPNSNSTP